MRWLKHIATRRSRRESPFAARAQSENRRQTLVTQQVLRSAEKFATGRHRLSPNPLHLLMGLLEAVGEHDLALMEVLTRYGLTLHRVRELTIWLTSLREEACGVTLGALMHEAYREASICDHHEVRPEHVLLSFLRSLSSLPPRLVEELRLADTAGAMQADVGRLLHQRTSGSGMLAEPAAA